MKSRLRIAYLINQHPMPSTTFVRREMAALEAAGHEVERYAIRHYAPLVDPQDLEESKRTRAILDQGPLGVLGGVLETATRHPRGFLRALRLAVQVGRKSDSGLARNLIYFAEACVLRGWVDESRPDHLHVHFGTNGATAAMLCRVMGGPPYSVTVHGPEEFDRATVLGLSEKIAHSAFMVGISEFGRSQLMRWADGQDWEKLKVVRCGLDASFLRQPRQPIDPAPRMVCVGRICEQKGQLLLVEAAAELHREGHDFELRIVGDGPMRPQLEERIAAHGLGDKVLLTGVATNDQVRQHLLESRALVLPSFAEGLPVVIMEALALGRPVVSTYITGIPELLEPGVTGWLVTPGAVKPLAQAMREVLDSPVETLESMGQAGAERVRARHDIERTAEVLAALIQDPTAAAD